MAARTGIASNISAVASRKQAQKQKQHRLGVIKPQHGILPKDQREAQSVTLTFAGPVARSSEWRASNAVLWKELGGVSTATVTVPAGVVRMIEFHE